MSNRRTYSPVTSRDFYNAAVPRTHWMDRLTLRGTVVLILAGTVAGFIGLVVLVSTLGYLASIWH